MINVMTGDIQIHQCCKVHVYKVQRAVLYTDVHVSSQLGQRPRVISLYLKAQRRCMLHILAISMK